MAAGNQAEKGIWALLVIAARRINDKKNKDLKLEEENNPKFKIAGFKFIEINNKIATSPKRLDKAVSILALNLFSLL